MRTAMFTVALGVLIFALSGNLSGLRAPAPSTPVHTEYAVESAPIVSASSVAPVRVDFDSQVKPILQAKCMPCHFSGGKMYERLPFDRPETIRKLGVKLFTRIQDENHRRIIREFLDET